MLLSLNIVLLLVFHKVYCGPIAVPEPELDGDHWNSTISPRLDALDIGTMTTIYGFEGCSSDDKTAVVQAFADAVDIAAAIAPSVDDIDKMQPYLYHNQVWWGKYTESDNADDWAKIKENLKRMRAIKDHWTVGDIVKRRYFKVRCHNDHDFPDKKGNSCTKGSEQNPIAHTVRKYANGNHYDVICLCDKWFTDFISFKEKVERMDTDTVYRKDNLMSLKTQGSTFLHEMLHTQYTNNDLAGLTDPPGVDKRLEGTRYEGRAYDVAKAKFIAAATYGGMQVALENVDNYVYFALWHYVLNRWDVKAWQPPSGWRNPTSISEMDSFPDYRDGIDNLPDDAYIAVVNQTFVDTGMYVDYGGKPCSVDSDCNGVCPPDYKYTCDGEIDGQTTCNCGFGFDPSKA